MSERGRDDLWTWFAPLWTDLRGIAPSLLLAGGYGLFLKQMRLIGGRKQAAEGELRTMVPVSRWLYETPRVTRDFDFIASLGLIASPEDQRRTGQLLESHGYTVVPENARWQFQRPIGNDEKICVDFHTPEPAGQRADLRWDNRRVKPRPSLGPEGIHGRTNPEAAGCYLHPFSFLWRELEIIVPNPVTWTVMKLVAMRDQWIKSQDAAAAADDRQQWRLQTVKHAEDTFRILAMATRDEVENAEEIIAAIQAGESFTAARQAFAQCLATPDTWGWQIVREKWQDDDFATIHAVMGRWFADENGSEP